MRVLLFLPPLLFTPLSVSAQDPGRIGSRILSMDSWTYEAIERLRNRAYLPGLNPLAQPYRRIDVAAELVDVDADTLREPVAGWVRMLMGELAPELSRLSESEDEAAEQRVGLQFLVGATGADSRRRDPLIPFRTSNNEGFRDRVWWSGAGGLWLETHNVAAETRSRYETWWLKNHGIRTAGIRVATSGSGVQTTPT